MRIIFQDNKTSVTPKNPQVVIKKMTICEISFKSAQLKALVSHSNLLTWGLAHPRYARQSLRIFHNENCSDAGLCKAVEEESPSANCRPSAALCRWCSHYTSCTPCLQFLSERIDE